MLNANDDVQQQQQESTSALGQYMISLIRTTQQLLGNAYGSAIKWSVICPSNDQLIDWGMEMIVDVVVERCRRTQCVIQMIGH